MIYAIFNCLFFFFLFFFYKNRNNKFDIYRIIVLLYLVTAVLCTINYTQKSYIWPDLSLLPFIYMFVVLIILFYPLKNFDLSTKETDWSDSGSLFLLGWFFIILSVFEVYFSINDVVNKFASGEWGRLRNELYADEGDIVYYSNIWEKLTKNILGYLHPFAVIYAFFQATNPKRKLYTILLFLSIVSATFVSATVVASRGMVFNQSMELVLGYMMFRDKIPSQVKKVVVTGGAAIISLFFIYAIIVSFSRFGEDDTGSSLFSYFGHSMLYFNDGLFNHMHDFAYGKRFFAWFIDLFGGNSAFDIAKAGSTHGTAFFTIVGGIFADWGYMGTIIVAILACLLICKFTKKRTIRLSDMVIIMFYINTLSGGIFAYGSSRGLQWIMTFVVYFIVKALEKPQRKILSEINKNYYVNI